MAAAEQPGLKPEDLDWLGRLKLLENYATSRALRGSGDKELRPLHDELNTWAKNTVLATLAGIVAGAGWQVHQSAKANPNLQPPADKALAERLAAEHIARIRSSGIRGGLRLGGLAAVYYGASMLATVALNRTDMWSHTAGSAATGALLGYSLRGPLGLAFGTIIGAASGVPLGMMWDDLGGKERGAPLFGAPAAGSADGAAGGEAAEPPPSYEGAVGYDAAAAMLAQLEEQQRRRQQQRAGAES